jgi:hypothetical protein
LLRFAPLSGGPKPASHQGWISEKPDYRWLTADG